MKHVYTLFRRWVSTTGFWTVLLHIRFQNLRGTRLICSSVAYLDASQIFCVCFRDGGTGAQPPVAIVVSGGGDGCGGGGGSGGSGGGAATTVFAELGLTVVHVQANSDTKPTRG